MIALSVPTGLVLASQDAVPGDKTYPVKRGLENVIVNLASLHPTTRAFFKTDMAGRRYKEAVALIRRGDQASSESLVELVTQTQAAATDISQISDPEAKKQLIDNLSKQIVQYKTGLSQLETTAPPVVSTQPLAQAPAQPVTQTAPQATSQQPPAPTATPVQTPPAAQGQVPPQAPPQAGASAQPTATEAPQAPITRPSPPNRPGPGFVPPPSAAPNMPFPPSDIGSTINNLDAIEAQLRALSAGARRGEDDGQSSSNRGKGGNNFLQYIKEGVGNSTNRNEKGETDTDKDNKD